MQAREPCNFTRYYDTDPQAIKYNPRFTLLSDGCLIECRAKGVIIIDIKEPSVWFEDSLKYLSESRNIVLPLQRYLLLSENGNGRQPLFSHGQRGSEAEQMQSEHISDSRNLCCFCRDTLSLAEDVYCRDPLFG